MVRGSLVGREAELSLLLRAVHEAFAGDPSAVVVAGEPGIGKTFLLGVLRDRVEALGDFRLLTRGDELPVFAFTTAPDVEAYDVFDVSRRMRESGWLLPAYTFPPKREDLSVLRVVCRNGFSADLADLFAGFGMTHVEGDDVARLKCP